MLKFTYETNDQEVKAWVDPTSGSLNFQIGKDSVNIPFELGYEMVMMLKQKQSIFQEQERRKIGAWNRLMTMLDRQPKENLTQINGSRYEVA